MMHNIYSCVGLLLLLLSDAFDRGRSLVISPPSSLRDYRQLAKLIVSTFDDPSTNKMRSQINKSLNKLSQTLLLKQDEKSIVPVEIRSVTVECS